MCHVARPWLGAALGCERHVAVTGPWCMEGACACLDSFVVLMRLPFANIWVVCAALVVLLLGVLLLVGPSGWSLFTAVRLRVRCAVVFLFRILNV